MPWIDKVNEDLTITTGDGKQYKPNWVDANYTQEFILREYNFIGMAGGYVDRREALANKFNITILFQGADNLDQARDFKESALNKKYWTIDHPLYGTIYAQPQTLTYDDSAFNVTQITGVLFETMLLEEVVQVGRNYLDLTEAKVEELKLDTEERYDAGVDMLSVKDKVSLKENLLKQMKEVSGQVKNIAEANKLKNAFNEAIALTSAPGVYAVDIVRSLHDIATLPAYFADTVQQRINVLVTQYNILKSTIATLTTRSSKRLYETRASGIVAGLFVSTMVNINYANTAEVEQVLAQVMEVYEDHNRTLEQLSNSDFDSAYMLDTAFGLMFNFMTLQMMNVSQERVLLLSQPSNPIEICAQLYGMDTEDVNLIRLITDNNIAGSELMYLDKGRAIKYYV